MQPCLRLVVYVFALIFFCVPAKAEGPSTQQQLEALNKQIERLKNDINSTQGNRSRAAKKLQRIETEIGALAAKLHRTETKYQQQSQKLNTLHQRQRTLQAQQAQQKEKIAEQLRKAYTLNQETPLKMLLNQENPDALTRNLTYYEYFNKARSKKVAEYKSTLQELERLLPAIIAEQEALEDTRKDLKDQQEELKEQQSDRRQQIAKLDKELGSQKGSLKNLGEERQALEDVLRRIDDDIANIAIPTNNEPFAKMRGKLRWPSSGKHLNRYGSPRQGSAVTWQGVQISGNQGNTIRAIHNGRVVFADWLRGTGLLIILDHGGGYLSLYGHNQSLLRQEGDWVKGGESIATLGNSGGKRQAGLYFEIRYKGRPVNPSQWCR
ncbi:membrane-bound metallopeptidase [Spongiibacter sp. IMCC21906]|uniref:murein hydrolase activator EnvC family protein n=1 Tax=Spongiibacter sp. IMCC21906 TaxID=1620392 RepID=UPI00062DEFDD|nr:peptidoglycan DD-metalloendopeptidase family protein [Spongiibacter sp. IMCC21906]AKH68514.1 membrane-bound metallopeptidase [Spongiibacter sp. IMCC21906]